jgi:hypothetical protein
MGVCIYNVCIREYITTHCILPVVYLVNCYVRLYIWLYSSSCMNSIAFIVL